MIDRAALILHHLELRGLTPHLRPRIEALLEGREDRTRLRCCHGGCYVCVEELKAIVVAVEAAVGDSTSSSTLL